jgi:ABC-type multidrug transport system fused ATPase/permease subunit
LTAAVAGVGLLWAVTQASHGCLSIGDIALLVAALAGVQSALGGLVDRFTSAHENALLFDHYRVLVNASPDLPLAFGAAEPLRSGIELHDVWFRYGPRAVPRGPARRVDRGDRAQAGRPHRGDVLRCRPDDQPNKIRSRP